MVRFAKHNQSTWRLSSDVLTLNHSYYFNGVLSSGYFIFKF